MQVLLDLVKASCLKTKLAYKWHVDSGLQRLVKYFKAIVLARDTLTVFSTMEVY